MKQDEKHPGFKPKIFTSPGIGSNYIGSHNHARNYMKNGTSPDNYRLPNGQLVSQPIYYRNYTFTEEEREKLWLQKLDKNERYILGERVVANSKREDIRRKAAQEKNERLGYGTGKKDWSKRKYEIEKRNILHREMKKKAKLNKN